MAFADVALQGTQDILESLGDSGIALYPVEASEVPTWLSQGGVAVDLSGAVDVRSIENDQGDVSIDNEEVILTTDQQTVADNSIVRHHSIGFQGALYDIVRILPDGPDAQLLYLRQCNV